MCLVQARAMTRRNNPKKQPKETTQREAKGDNAMKTLFTTVALLALVTTPVLAQTKDRVSQRTRAEAPQAYTTQQQRSANRANDVYDIRGQRVGTDPDPTIRAQIANDPTQSSE
jgi:hypothetical protein